MNSLAFWVDADGSIDVLHQSRMMLALELDVAALESPGLTERAPRDQSACINGHELRIRNRNTAFDAVNRRSYTLHCLTVSIRIQDQDPSSLVGDCRIHDLRRRTRHVQPLSLTCAFTRA